MLPEVTLKSSYKGIPIYCSYSIDSLTVSNYLSFEKITTKQESLELEAHNEYFNDAQIIYCSKGDCLIGVIENEAKEQEINYFKHAFKEKGLICRECNK